MLFIVKVVPGTIWGLSRFFVTSQDIGNVVEAYTLFVTRCRCFRQDLFWAVFHLLSETACKMIIFMPKIKKLFLPWWPFVFHLVGFFRFVNVACQTRRSWRFLLCQNFRGGHRQDVQAPHQAYQGLWPQGGQGQYLTVIRVETLSFNSTIYNDCKIVIFAQKKALPQGLLMQFYYKT